MLPSVVREGTGHFQSILTTANVTYINDPSQTSQYDAVHVSFDLYLRLFPQEDLDKQDLDGRFADSFVDKFLLIKLLGVPDYFNDYRIFKISSLLDGKSLGTGAHGSNSVAFINHSTLLPFHNSLTVNHAVVQSIPISAIPHLDKIFVAVPGEIYDTLRGNNSANSIKNQFLTTFLKHSGGVVNSGDSVRLINGEIKLCEPVPQGLVTQATEIVLVKEVHESWAADDEEVEMESEEEPIDDDEDVDLSAYLSSSIRLDSPAPSSSVPQLHKFKPRPLPTKITIDKVPSFLIKEDPELFVFVSTDDLPKLGFPVFNGDSVHLVYHNDSQVVVKLFTILEPNKTFRKGTIYLSPLLLLNLNLDKSSEVHLSPIENAKSSLFQDLIPVAKSVTVSRVASSITMDKTYQQSFLSALKATFHSHLKVFKAEDFLPVTIDSVLAKSLFDTKFTHSQHDENTQEAEADDDNIVPDGDPDSVAWFKIIDISGPENLNGLTQYIIDPLKTTLISSGVEFVSAPRNEFYQWHEYLGLPPLFNFNRFTNDVDATDFKYAIELKKIVQTCLNSNSKLNLKTSVLLNSMSRGLGKTSLVRNLSLELGLNLIEIDCFDLINPGAELKTIGLLTGKIDKLIAQQEDNAVTTNSSFHLIYLKHIENLCTQLNANEQGANITTSLALKIIKVLNDYFEKYRNLMIVFSCNDIDKLNDSLRLLIKFQVNFNVPNENERSEIFKFLIQNEVKSGSANDVAPELFEDRLEFNQSFDVSAVSFSKRHDIKFQTLALQSAGLTPRDLISIIKKSKQLAIMRTIALSKSHNISLDKLIKVGGGGHIIWIPDDFNAAINDARNQFSDSIGAPRIPNVKWEDIGGLDLVKDEILDTIDMPLKHPELFNNGLKKRSGILFYGPPGTGKTLLAKAIATNFSLNFFSVKGPELLNMYIGESEANVRKVFQRARDAKPCVIFFDELDSVAPKRGNQGDSGGVMDRIVSQLLAELDGMSGGGSDSGGDGVFVVGATNRPDLLDEALLRPGRFDKMLYLGISDTNDKQLKILEALTRKFLLDSAVDLSKIAERCTFNFTGADFYALCSDSMLNAMTRISNEVDTKIKAYNAKLASEGKEEVSTRWWFDNVATKDDTDVLVTMADFQRATDELVPSVSAEELNHYLKVRENFEGGKEKEKKTETKATERGPEDFRFEFNRRLQQLVGEGIDRVEDENGRSILGAENGYENGHENGHDNLEKVNGNTDAANVNTENASRENARSGSYESTENGNGQ